MLLFVGEYSIKAKGTQLSAPAPLSDKLGWRCEGDAQCIFYVCDFSPRGKCFSTNDQGFSIGVSGDPVLEGGGGSERQMELLAQCCHSARDLQGILSNANGVFCGFAYSKVSRQLLLFGDYLGFRHVYLYNDGDRLVFSNALWLLRDSVGATLDYSLDSLVEIGVLGYPLDNRTKYSGVTMLPAGSIAEVTSEKGLMIREYFSLRDVPINDSLSEDEALQAVEEVVKLAIKDRLREERSAFGFLSGGMDSRLVLYFLRHFECVVASANFAPEHSADFVFGQQAASSLGTEHYHCPIDDPGCDLAKIAVSSWMKTVGKNADFFRSSCIVWSGDGGSVGLGHVYLTDDLIDVAESGDFRETSRLFLDFNRRVLPRRVFRDPSAMDRLIDRIASSIEECCGSGRERALYKFLMLNDQRRHLDAHYENFHVRGFDFSLPLLDKRLIQLVCSLPVRWFNYHRIYDKLYSEIGGELTAVPWQTYPGHVPCKQEYHKDLVYQWGDGFYSKESSFNAAAKESREALFFIFSRGASHFGILYVFVSLLLTSLKIQDRGYVAKYVRPILS